MISKECVAMILAGGRGEQLGALTRHNSKPAVYFGRKYRIIDFTLNNCRHSKIGVIGILSQYFSDDLDMYINYQNDYKTDGGSICMLQPKKNDVYIGTADAVYKNIDFIEKYGPEYVLVLSGDNIYKMDYSELIAYHKCTGADVTIASTRVSANDVSKYGYISADRFGRIYDFEKKPNNPKSGLASIGVYVFKWNILKNYLLSDSINEQSQHDFVRDIFPFMLHTGRRLYTYLFNEYWRDIGTLDNLWEANIDQIHYPFSFNFWEYEKEMLKMRLTNMSHIPLGMTIIQSLVSNDSYIRGRVEHSVLGEQVTIDRGAEVIDSYIMPGAYIGNKAKIYKTIVGEGAVIMDNTVIGEINGTDFFIDKMVCAKGISLVAPRLHIADGMKFQAGSHIYTEKLQEMSTINNKAG